jgi:hypothetical protein
MMKILPTILLGATLSLSMLELAQAQERMEQTLALVNVAAGKSASQSSTGWGGIASRAVDGNLNGHFDYGSVTHTDISIASWWEVDLQQTAVIRWITLYNRTDCCASRLRNFTVQILDVDRAVVKQFITNDTAPISSNYFANGSIGRYVRVQLNGNDYLSLTEVQVWADSSKE